MKSIANQLQLLLETYIPELNTLEENRSSSKSLPTKWSKKEIIGHLVDSAQNNLRRFLVAQYEDKPVIIYKQDFWVSAINYQQWPVKDLVQLWHLSNKQIIQVISTMPKEAAGRICETQSSHTLEWLAEDYIKHLKHHLHQILDKEEIPYP